MNHLFLQGDSIEVLKAIADSSIDSCVTDPPYGWRFMGKAWDGADIVEKVTDRRRYHQNEDPRAGELGGHNSIAAEAGKYNQTLEGNQSFQVWTHDWAREVYRVLKPGAHMLVFCGPRTYHRMASGVEDAGFEIRDQIQWLFASGFPKSLDVSKAIDKTQGAERKVVGTRNNGAGNKPNGNSFDDDNYEWSKTVNLTAPATDKARYWDGWGTALKPANEPIVLARKPLEKGLTVAQNVLKWGTGALNINGCKISTDESLKGGATGKRTALLNYGGTNPRPNHSRAGEQSADRRYKEKGSTNFAAKPGARSDTQARWPANVIHDGSEEVLEHFPEQTSGANPTRRGSPKFRNAYSEFQGQEECEPMCWAESGSAARFFYCAKTDRNDRNAGLDAATNHHPTVKPTKLMQYLCRLVTPPGGIVLDPFLGSGSTAKAALIERFQCVGIEMDEEYLKIARHRLNELQVGLF